MSHEIPERRRDDVRAVMDALSGVGSAVLTTHVNADGDGCGSSLALAAWLRARGTEAWFIPPTPYPDMYRFFVTEEDWILDARSEEAAARCSEADLAVILDTGDVPRIGRVKPLIDHLPKVVIDHHPPGDRPIDGTAIRDPKASATGELVYDLVASTDGPWHPMVVDGLYVAILTDTGSFRFSNSSPAAHRVTADLIARGADVEETYRKVYGTYPLRRFRLLEHVLPTLSVSDDGRVAWMTVPRDVYEELDAIPDDLEGVVDYPRGVEGVEVGLLFRETDSGATKISFRANGDVDVNALARKFGGGGHVKASGALVERPLEEVRAEVVRATRAAVDESLDDAGTSHDQEGSED